MFLVHFKLSDTDLNFTVSAFKDSFDGLYCDHLCSVADTRLGNIIGPCLSQCSGFVCKYDR